MALADKKNKSGTVKTGPAPAAKRRIELHTGEAGVVRSTDVFNGGTAIGVSAGAPAVVDWEAMAQHARQARQPLTWREVFTPGGRFFYISKPVMIAVLMGLVGGLAVSAFAQYTDRIPYESFSVRGQELLSKKEARPAVEYFLAQSRRTEIETFPGSPYHLAALEGLAQAYANDKCNVSADDTFNRVISLLRHARFKDDVRLSAALEHYGNFLAHLKRDAAARQCFDEVKQLHGQNRGGVWIAFFAILAFGFEAIYMSGVLLGDKPKLENWFVYAGFAMMGALGSAVGLFLCGAPIIASLAISICAVYGLMPALLLAACAMGKNMPAYHVLLPSHKRK